MLLSRVHQAYFSKMAMFSHAIIVANSTSNKWPGNRFYKQNSKSNRFYVKEYLYKNTGRIDTFRIGYQITLLLIEFANKCPPDRRFWMFHSFEDPEYDVMKHFAKWLFGNHHRKFVALANNFKGVVYAFCPDGFCKTLFHWFSEKYNVQQLIF